MCTNEDPVKIEEFEKWFNDKLQKDGMVFLNEVTDKFHELFEIPKSWDLDSDYIISLLSKDSA